MTPSHLFSNGGSQSELPLKNRATESGSHDTASCIDLLIR